MERYEIEAKLRKAFKEKPMDVTEYDKLLKIKRFHKAEALRVAIWNQLVADYLEYESTKCMRCWDCIGYLQTEYKKLLKIETKLMA